MKPRHSLKRSSSYPLAVVRHPRPRAKQIRAARIMCQLQSIGPTDEFQASRSSGRCIVQWSDDAKGMSSYLPSEEVQIVIESRERECMSPFAER